MTDKERSNDAQGSGESIPPPSAHRADRVVRAVSAEARQEMERGRQLRNVEPFTKGNHGPTVDQSRYPYSVEDMDAVLSDAPRAIFPDAPGGDGATPLSAEREAFLAAMGDRGRFPSQKETSRWARAVFNALRHYAVDHDDALATEFKDMVRFGEAPEVQIEEMMWGGDYLERMSRTLTVAGTWTKAEFYEQVAEEAGTTADAPWVDAAIYSFLGTLKTLLDGEHTQTKLGELQAIWDRA